jgi:hypothetical protein
MCNLVLRVLESGCWHEGHPDADLLGHRPIVIDAVRVPVQSRAQGKSELVRTAC